MLKLFFKIVFVLLLALAAFTYFYSQRPEFGRTPTGKRLERIPTAVRNGKLAFTASVNGLNGARMYYEIVCNGRSRCR